MHGIAARCAQNVPEGILKRGSGYAAVLDCLTEHHCSLLDCRHIVVVDERNYVAGIITRCDLARAAGSWLGRGGSGAQPGVTDLDSLFELPHGGASEAVGNAWVVACTADC